jgi:hypothetical protein
VMARPAKDEVERFQAHIRDVPSGCREWQSKRDKGGYGHFTRRDGVDVRAHRFAWEKFVGPIPEGMLVLHRCDNPRCVNTAHLFIGNHADNARDMVQKGRHWGRRALDEDGVAEARRLIESSAYSQTGIAGILGINQTTVSRLKLGRQSYAVKHSA